MDRAVDLPGDDLLDALGDQRDDQIDDALLVAFTAPAPAWGRRRAGPAIGAVARGAVAIIAVAAVLMVAVAVAVAVIAVIAAAVVVAAIAVFQAALQVVDAMEQLVNAVVVHLHLPLEHASGCGPAYSSKGMGGDYSG